MSTKGSIQDCPCGCERENVLHPSSVDFKLVDLPQEASLKLQEDALDALAPLPALLASLVVDPDFPKRKEWADEMLGPVVDVLLRGGRL